MILVALAGAGELLALILWVAGLFDKIDSGHLIAIVIIPIALGVIPIIAIVVGIRRSRPAPFLPERGGDCLLMVLVITNAAAMLTYGAMMTSGF